MMPDVRAAANVFHRQRMSEVCADMRKKGAASLRPDWSEAERREWFRLYVRPIFRYDALHNPTDDYTFAHKVRLGVFEIKEPATVTETAPLYISA